MKNLIGFTLATLLTTLPVSAISQDHSQSQPYAGFETREIKSLSASDIEQLQRGGGWGLALPAELNGKPGPAHLLELSDQLGLSGDQIASIQTIYDVMKADAIATGERLIAAELALDQGFTSGSLTAEKLRDLLAVSAQAREDLRFIHLSQHLKTPMLLTAEQITKYNVLRGYADDPCASVPEGHDPAMWRQHNGCE